MSKRFANKVAVVTGGNSGIGLAAARAYLREGAQVAITGRSDTTLKAAQKKLGADALVIKADMSRVCEIAGAMDQIKNKFGRIDALFANAGVGKFVPFEEVTEQFFDETMATNLKGVFFTVQKAAPLFSKGAAVVLNASINAHLGMPNSSVYGASKAAVVNLAKTLSADLLHRGVRVNVVSPGPIVTAIFDRMGLSEEQTPADQGVDRLAGPAEALRPRRRDRRRRALPLVERVGVRGRDGARGRRRDDRALRSGAGSGYSLHSTGKSSPAFSGDSVTPGDSGFKRL